MPGRTIAIGDIHGCDVALISMLNELQPAEEDTVIILGDVIDRGPRSRRVVDTLLELKNDCRLLLLMGNHEEMMLDALQGGPWRDGWLRYGGRETLASYDGKVSEIPPAHLDLLQDGLDYCETDETIFVHANLEPGVPLDEQSPHWLRWEKLGPNPPPHESGRLVVCGHTAQQNGVPRISPGWLCIDSCVYDTGRLTAFEVETGMLHQSLQNGEYWGALPLADFA